MENNEKILDGHTDLEKGAYLGAIASIASADRIASPEEIQYLSNLCDNAGLSERQKAAVLRAAGDETGNDLPECLEVLKKSELKYSLVADLMAFAKSDSDYTEEERENIEKISAYLEINEQQTSLLDEFSEKAKVAETAPEEMSKPGFLSALGLKDKLQNAGINGNRLLKGLLGIAGPLILSGLLTRRSRRGTNNMLGSGGGLRSLIGMLSGGRSMNTSGGLFGRILRGGI